MTDSLRPILLIEDNPMDVDLTMRAFRKRRISNPVEVLRDGEEALEWMSHREDGQELPLVILLDLKLPKVSGLEVLAKLKGDAILRRVPVVVLTTSAENQDVKSAYELGVNSYIVKPVSFEKFLEVAGQIELYWTLLNQPPE
jgi:CheY-like chemotaxis protein